MQKQGGGMLAGIAPESSQGEAGSGESSDNDRASWVSLERTILVIAIFILAPLFIASRGDPYPIHLSARSWFVLLTSALVVFVVLSVAQAGANALSLGPSFRMLIQLSCYFVVLSCFAFPLSERSGMEEAGSVGVNVPNLAICCVLATLLFVVSELSVNYVRFGILAYVIGNVLVIGYAFASDASIEMGGPLSVSAHKNIFVVSFDGLSGSAVTEILRKDEELAAELQGFVTFEAVASSSPATSASIAAELSGNQNFKEFAGTTDGLWDALRDRLLTNVLIDHGYSVTTYGTYGKELGGAGNQIRGSVLPNFTASDVLEVAWSRTLTPLVAGGPLGTVVEGLLHSQDKRGSDPNVLGERITNSLSPSWDKNLTYTVVDFEGMLDSLQVDQEEPAAFFFHFTHTHYPVEWAASCEFMGGDEMWYLSHQNRAGVLEESTCAIKQFSRFLEKVRDLGVLDNSLVVLKSDHGKPIAYAREGSLEASAINGHELWGMSRYAPFLAVRSEAATGELRFDSSPVILDDLARTICEEAQISFDCGRYSGYNVLQLGDEIDPLTPITAFIAPSPDADYRFDSHIAVGFTRGEGVLMSLYETLVSKSMAQETPVEVLSSP